MCIYIYMRVCESIAYITNLYNAYVNITDLETLECSEHSSRALPGVIHACAKLYVRTKVVYQINARIICPAHLLHSSD